MNHIRHIAVVTDSSGSVVLRMHTRTDRPNGEIDVEFKNKEAAERGLKAIEASLAHELTVLDGN